jgi:hypothetical protein
MKILYISLWVVISCSMFYSQQSKSEDLEKFLQNIKEKLEEQQKAQEKAKKEIDKKNKPKIKKQIRERISNPFSAPHRKAIKTGAENNTSKTPSFSSTSVSEDKSFTNYYTLKTTINRILNQNPTLMPFKFPDIQQYISKARIGIADSNKNEVSTSAEDISKYEDLRDAIKKLISDAVVNLWRFWVFVWTLFKDEKRLYLIHKELCPGEIYTVAGQLKESKEIFSLALEDGIMSFTIDSRTLNLIVNLLAKKGEVFYIYEQFDKVVATGKVRLDFNKSLCYNLAVFAYIGMSKEVYNYPPISRILKCWSAIENPRVTAQERNNVCANANSDIEMAYNRLVKYLSSGEKIYKRLLIPTFYRMCYDKCLCADLGIKCQKDQVGGGRVTGIKQTIGVLAYEAIYKDLFKFAEGTYTSLVDSKLNTISVENNCSFSNPPWKEKLEKIIRNRTKERADNPKEVDEIVKYIFQYNFLEAFETLKNKFPDIFFEVVSSDEFNFLINEIQEFTEVLKSKAFKGKDICSLLLLSSIAIQRKNTNSGRAILQEIVNYNLDIILYVLRSIGFGGVLTGEESPYDITDILTKLFSLPYYVYRNVSVYKLQKCGYTLNLPQSDVGYLTLTIEKYKCIFEDLQLSLKCLFTNSPIVRDIVEKTNTTLLNTEELIGKISGKKPTDYSDQFRNFCENTDNVNCYNLLEKIQNWAISNMQNYGVCENSKYEKIKDYCPFTGLEQCPAEPVSEAKYCYKDMEVYYTFEKKEGGWCFGPECKCYLDSDKDCNDLHSFLSSAFSDCCNTKEKLKAAGIPKVEDVCKYFYEKVGSCCRILSQGDENLFFKVQRFKNNMAFCKEVFNIRDLKESLDSLFTNIKDENYRLGIFYYELLKNQLKNIKTLWENRDRCPFK